MSKKLFALEHCRGLVPSILLDDRRTAEFRESWKTTKQSFAIARVRYLVEPFFSLFAHLSVIVTHGFGYFNLHFRHVCLFIIGTPKTPSSCTYLILLMSKSKVSDPVNHSPSSIPTFLHHGVLPSEASRGSSILSERLTILSASPTCRLALTSRLFTSLFKRMPLPLYASVRLALLSKPPAPILLDSVCLPTRVNPWDERESTAAPSLLVHSSLMTGRCHCSGSDEEESRFRWRYTSVP